jgi:hypothetical protein
VSYCRFSSDNWASDVYVYADVSGGYTTHVAGNRVVGDVPIADFEALCSKAITAEEFADQHRAQMDFLRDAKREEIGLPHDGATFNLDLKDTIAMLEMLRVEGYHIPQYALDELRADLKEEP